MPTPPAPSLASNYRYGTVTVDVQQTSYSTDLYASRNANSDSHSPSNANPRSQRPSQLPRLRPSQPPHLLLIQEEAADRVDLDLRAVAENSGSGHCGGGSSWRPREVVLPAERAVAVSPGHPLRQDSQFSCFADQCSSYLGRHPRIRWGSH